MITIVIIECQEKREREKSSEFMIEYEQKKFLQFSLTKKQSW